MADELGKLLGLRKMLSPMESGMAGLSGVGARRVRSKKKKKVGVSKKLEGLGIEGKEAQQSFLKKTLTGPTAVRNAIMLWLMEPEDIDDGMRGKKDMPADKALYHAIGGSGGS